MYHRFFLTPDAFVIKSGDTARFYCNLTDNFLESDAAISPERIKSCKVSSMDEEIEIQDFSVKDKSLVFEMSGLKDGSYVINMALKTRIIDLEAERFKSYLLHENLAGILNLIETQRFHKDIYKEEYTHYAKTILQVGDIKDNLNFFKKPSGNKIEIIPEIEPMRLKAGDIFVVKVLCEGKPLSFTTISYGSSQYPYTTQTDENGAAKIKLGSSGKWFIHTIHMIPSKKLPEIDWESFWATLTFEVRD